MKTENEIKALPLEEQQKLVIELRTIKTGDKAYANAKAIIDLITKLKGWKEPAMVEVQNISGHEVSVDGNVIAADATGKVFPWQQVALARFLEVVGKAAALILFCALLLLGSQATAYDTPFVASLNGGTNNVVKGATNSYNVATYVTNTIISPVVTVSNGVTYFTATTNVTSIVTNVPGVFSVGNYDLFDIQVSLALDGAGTTACPVSWSTSDDAVTWTTGAFTTSVTPAGTAQACARTNLSLFAPGYIRLDTIGDPNANTGNITNLQVIVARKQSRTGP